MKKIVIADDHSIIRQGLKFIINKHQDLKVVAEAASSFELMDSLSENEVDIIIIDINMPGKFIIDTITDINEKYSETKIIVFTVSPENQFADKVFMAGAHGYLNKENESEEIIEAIKTVCCGKYYMSQEYSSELFELQGNKNIGSDNRLSSRELNVLAMIANGDNPTKISEELFLSKNTVNNHRKNIMKKLNLNSTADLVKYAIKNRIVE